MPVPPIPPPLESLGHRPFCFYPPIIGVEHNEWRYIRATWSEVVVVNVKSAQEIFVPRHFLGEVSRIDEPLVIVGLRKELEYRMGQIWPHERRVIEMPRAVNDHAFRSREPVVGGPMQPAPVISIRLESGPERKVGRMISMVLVTAIFGTVVAFSFFRGRSNGTHIFYRPLLQRDLDLQPTDDYDSIVSKWGPPGEDAWRSEAGEVQFRKMEYPARGLTLILMGRDRLHALYVGAMNEQWRPVSTVRLPHDGGDTSSLLNQLPRF